MAREARGRGNHGQEGGPGAGTNGQEGQGREPIGQEARGREPIGQGRPGGGKPLGIYLFLVESASAHKSCIREIAVLAIRRRREVH